MSVKKMTLYSLHCKKIEEINQDINSIPDIQKHMEYLKEKILSIKSNDELDKYKTELEECRCKLEKIPDGMTDYYLQNGELLWNYTQQDTSKHKKPCNMTEILKKKGKITDNKSAKSKFFQQYRANIDPTFIHIIDQKINPDNYCYDCDQLRILIPTESKMICESCGQETTVIIGPDKLSLKDPPAETRCYKYKRFGHFCDWLSNLQGKESNGVPEEIIDMVLCEIKRERLDSCLDQVSEETICRYLKKHSKLKPKIPFNKYYDHAVQILFKITKIPPMTMTEEMEQNLKFMFLKIQEPFERHRQDRSNFISYSYIIYKFCQLLGEDDTEYRKFAKKLKLHKSMDKLHEDDKTWKLICNELGGAEEGWKYKPS